VSAGWVASSVRARAMTRRRIGRAAARDLAASPSLNDALRALIQTPYSHDVRLGQTLAEAQHAVVQTTVWNLRVLAGWAPQRGAAMLRVLLGAVEAANLADHLRALSGADVPPPYQLGTMDTAWTRLASAASADAVRQVLATSVWGDPGGDTPNEIILATRTALADRVISAVPVAAGWAVGWTALLVARETVLGGHELPKRAHDMAIRVLGRAALTARTLPQLAAAVPTVGGGVFDDIAQPDQLWLAEARWWRRVEHEGRSLARRAVAGPEILVGTAAVLAADAWRVRAALELAARGGAPMEAFDAVA
jgi:hypothetical protein